MKSDLRKSMLQKRLMLSKEEVEKRSLKVIDNLLKVVDLNKLNNIMLYYPIKNEVSTLSLIEICFNKGKKVILPKVLKDVKEILPCKINSFEDLIVGEYGILEPKTFEVIDKNDIDIVIVPGVAFSKDGFRLGYGAGYYDRFLCDYKGLKIGICYSFQLLDDVFQQEHDVIMNCIITEEQIIEVKDFK
ncbi:5-formyltetrahydrofolate cyclo-ligase [Caloramator fervidus]|uniref:5-formyltetrahydrofolate cyclo-ligase n=1 Tax=Caloramator fervidus TaxID=29344 RepID=A0A1H5VT31_9CLOT|nr:5-formyltetrahydrofolate cyclo-ligase [Caloramator fervidus]SEF90380.1 5-formyltetrahydrofolate cyclo-ligase [Caloramator fervidus]